MQLAPGLFDQDFAQLAVSRSARVDYIQQPKLKNVVLVGHSFGGSVIQKVAEEIPNRIERMVFLNALIVEDGHCVFDELPADYVGMLELNR